jgi:hypothetical protein
MQNCIPLDQCIEGGLYQIRSRNLNYGVFTENRFIGIREKFGYVYLESDYHVESGQRGSCSPKEFLEMCPIPLNKEDTLFNWLKEMEKRYYDWRWS